MKPRLSTRVEPRVDKHRDPTGHPPIPSLLLITYTTTAAPAAITSKTIAITAITFDPPFGVGEAVATGCAAAVLTGV